MIATWFPGTVNKLTTTAIRHASDLAIDRDHEPSCAPDVRGVVNMLRHEYTDDDMDQSVGRHAEAGLVTVVVAA